jgi:multiple sugar transport system substrate-binding protein
MNTQIMSHGGQEMSRRSALILIALVLSQAMVFAGGNRAGGGGKTTITIGGWPSADLVFNIALPGFKAKYPNIEVEYEMSSWGDHHQSLQTSLAAGSGARDAEMVETTYIAQYRDSLVLEDLYNAPYNARKYQNDFVSYKWEQGTSSDKKRLVALPWDIGPMCYYYRADVFESVGLPSEPEEVARFMSTWEGVMEVARRVYIPNQRWLISDASILYTILWRNRDFFDEKLNFQLDRDGDIAALQAVIEMRRNRLDMNTTSEAEINAALQNSALVSIISASWYEANLKEVYCADQAGKWRITSLPGGIKTMNYGGSNMCIPSQGKHKNEAWAFIEYMLASTQGQNDMFKAMGYFPAYIPAWNDPVYNERDPYYGGQSVKAMWKQIAQTMNTKVYTTLMDGAVDQELTPAVNEGLERGLSPAAIKQLFREKVDASIMEPKRQQIEILRTAGLWN